MFCPKCGKELRAGGNFCTSCGTRLNFTADGAPGAAQNVPPAGEPRQTYEQPQYEQPQYEQPQYEQPQYEQPQYEQRGYDQYYGNGVDIDDYYGEAPAPKKSKKPLFITLGIIAAAAVVVLVLFLTGVLGNGFGFGKTTQDKLDSASRKTLDAVANRSEVLGFANSLTKMEKFGINIKAEDVGGLLPTYMVGAVSYLDINAEIDVAADREGNMSMTIEGDVAGQDVKAGVYSEKGKDTEIAIDAPSVIADPLGLSLSSLEEDFDDSIFSPDSDSDYALPEYTAEYITQMGESFDSIGSILSVADTEELKKELQSDEETRLDYEKSKGEVTVGGETVNCEIYTTSIDEEKIEAIADKMLDWMDEKIDLSATGVSFSSLSGQISDGLENTKMDLDLEYDLYKGYLVRVAVSGKVQGQKMSLTIDFGTDPAKTEEIKAVMKIKSEYYDEDIDFKATIDLSKADDGQINMVVESEFSDIYFEFNLDYDKKAKEFELTATNAYSDFRLTGDMEVTKDSIMIGNPAFYNANEELFALEGISVTISSNATVKKLKDDFPNGYTSILSLDEDEFAELIENFQSFVQDLF